MLLYDRMVFMQIGVNKVKHIIYGFVDNGISYGRSKKKMVAISMFPVSSEIYGLERGYSTDFRDGYPVVLLYYYGVNFRYRNKRL